MHQKLLVYGTVLGFEDEAEHILAVDPEPLALGKSTTASVQVYEEVPLDPETEAFHRLMGREVEWMLVNTEDIVDDSVASGTGRVVVKGSNARVEVAGRHGVKFRSESVSVAAIRGILLHVA